MKVRCTGDGLGVHPLAAGDEAATELPAVYFALFYPSDHSTASTTSVLQSILKMGDLAFRDMLRLQILGGQAT